MDYVDHQRLLGQSQLGANEGAPVTLKAQRRAQRVRSLFELLHQRALLPKIMTKQINVTRPSMRQICTSKRRAPT
jgi:hypothetical protein